MTYLQRLLATGPAPAPGPAAAPVPSAGATPSLAPATGPAISPIIAADQRLAVFPALIDAMAPDRGQDEPHADVRIAPRSDRRDRTSRTPVGPAPPDGAFEVPRPVSPPARVEPEVRSGAPIASRDQGTKPAAAATDQADPAKPATAVAETPPVAVSLWQRIVEEAPLDRPATPPDQQLQQAEPPHTRADAVAPPLPLETRDHASNREAAPSRAVAPTPGRSVVERPAEPPRQSPVWPIPPDALQPLERPIEAAAAVLSPDPAPATRQPRPPAAAIPAESASPLARPGVEMLAPVAPPRAPATPDAPATVAREVRVIERIREVPAPSPPPKMTAADASVIGPLCRKGRRPRQAKFGLSR